MNRERLLRLLRGRLIYVKIVTAAIWLTWLVSIASTGFQKDAEGHSIGTDHVAFYSAARLVYEGRGVLMYDYHFLAQYQPRLTDHDGGFLDAYRNPPFYALLYVPSAMLPYIWSFWIWTAISLALLGLGIGWLNSEHRFSAFLLSLSFFPISSVFGFGQNSLLSFGILCLCFRFLDRGYRFWAGVIAGFVLYKPQLLLGLGLWWLLSIRRYWPCFMGLGVTSLFWAVLSVLFVPEETRLFIAKMKEIAEYDCFMFWNMHNPRGFGVLIAYDDKEVGKIVGLIALFAAVVFFGFFWRKHRGEPAVMFAVAIFLTLWASPHTMIYEWSLAIIPAVLLWERVPEKRDDWRLIFALAWIALMISTPIARFLFESTQDAHGHGWAIQLSVPVLGIIGIWAARVLRGTETTRSDNNP